MVFSMAPKSGDARIQFTPCARFFEKKIARAALSNGRAAGAR